MSVNFRVIDTILPPELVQCIQTPYDDETPSQHEERMVSVATMIAKLLKETVLSVEKRCIKDLDANPGDRGCQLRAVILKKLVTTPDVIVELEQLKAAANAVYRAVIRRNSLNGKLKARDDTTRVFFEKHISSLEVSREMMYILQCKLLTATKVKDRVEPTGVIVTRLDFCALSKFSSTIHIIDKLEKDFREQIVCEAAAWLSQESLSLIQEEGKKRVLSPLFARMLMEVRQNKPTPPQKHKSFGLYKPKSFGCQLYEMQMVLTILREQEALIAIKTVVAKGKPQMLFLKPSKRGDEFGPVDITGVPKETLIVVFEGVVKPQLSFESFTEQVERIGFTHLMLAYISQEDPFEHNSTLSDVADPEAYVEIEAYRKLAAEIDLPITMDHVFCNSLEEELKTC